MPASNRLIFAKTRLRDLGAPAKGRKYFYDDACPGLALCVTAAGARTFYFCRKVDGRAVKLKLGKFGDMTVEDARKHARELLVDAAAGKPIEAERRERRHGATLGDLLEHYLEHHAKPNKRTWRTDEQVYNRYMKAWGNRKLSQIQKRDVQAVHAKVGKKNGTYAANRLLALIHTMFAVGTEDGLHKGDNPAKGVRKFPEEKRDRFLDAGELKRFFASLNEETNERVRDYLWLLLFTAARRMNAMQMKWEEIDFDHKLWRIPDTKNGEPLVVPLTDAAMNVLHGRMEASRDSEYVFPGRGKAGHLLDPTKVWKRVKKRAGLENVRLHDLRRTIASWQALTGSSLLVIGKSLGHKDVTTTQVYARLTVAPIRESMKRATDAMFEAANRKDRSDE